MTNEAYKNLTFDEIKIALRNYLESKSEYADHNFDGSTWGLILDVLSWTTHYMGVHASLALNEAFLESAQIRRNVVSRAKELGYFPKQNTAATAAISLTLNGQSTGQTIVVPAGIKFSSELDGNSYTFQTVGITSMIEDGTTGNYTSESDVIIKQGFDNTITFSSIQAGDTFVINDRLIDTDTLTVTVGGIEWTNANQQLITDGESQVYFIQEVDEGSVEIFFGDDIIGAAPAVGTNIVCNWLSTKGEDANAIGSFSLVDSIGGYAANLWGITVTSASGGGSGAESIERIKLVAPKVFQTQNRLVTADDYEALILANFSYIEAISVWGGETNVPPKFGAVLVSIAKSGNNQALLTDTEKTDIINFINQYKVLTQSIEIVDPNFLIIDQTIDVTYNQYRTTLSPDDLELIVQAAVNSYFTTNLTSFNSTLRLSRFLSQIHDADPSFLDANASFRLTREYQQPVNTFQLPHTIALNYSSNSIVPGTWTSSVFDTNKTLVDNGNGRVQLFSGVDVINSNIGNIDYQAGTVTINNITIVDAGATPADQSTYEVIRFSCETTNFNVTALQNTIFSVGTQDITMNLITRDE